MENEIFKEMKPLSNCKGFFIHPSGILYNQEKDCDVQPDKRGYVFIHRKKVNFAKLILEHYSGIKMRKGRITFKDGNERNFNFENLKYSNMEPVSINKENLIIAIRCYFKIGEKYNLRNSLITRTHLLIIANHRQFFYRKRKDKHIDTFQYYLSNFGGIQQTAIEYNLGVRNCKGIINRFVNMLVEEVLKDLDSGLLTMKKIKPEPKSQRQLLREFKKTIEDIQKQQ